MKNYEVASRYAKAVFSLAQETNESEKLIAEINALKDVLQDAELKAHLNSPIVGEEEKKKIVNRLLEAAEFSTTVKSFMNLLVDKSRLNHIAEIAELLQKYQDEAAGVIRGDVVSATELNDSEKSEIENKISSLLNKKLQLEYKQDASILGGVVVKVGDYTVDYSVNRQLERIKESLNEGVQ